MFKYFLTVNGVLTFLYFGWFSILFLSEILENLNNTKKNSDSISFRYIGDFNILYKEDVY
jgi:hypothetical protein